MLFFIYVKIFDFYVYNFRDRPARRALRLGGGFVKQNRIYCDCSAICATGPHVFVYVKRQLIPDYFWCPEGHSVFQFACQIPGRYLKNAIEYIHKISHIPPYVLEVFVAPPEIIKKIISEALLRNAIQINVLQRIFYIKSTLCKICAKFLFMKISTFFSQQFQLIFRFNYKLQSSCRGNFNRPQFESPAI